MTVVTSHVDSVWVEASAVGRRRGAESACAWLSEGARACLLDLASRGRWGGRRRDVRGGRRASAWCAGWAAGMAARHRVALWD